MLQRLKPPGAATHRRLDRDQGTSMSHRLPSEGKTRSDVALVIEAALKVIAKHTPA